MKLNKYLSILMLFVLGCGSPATIGWFEGTFEEAQLAAGDKLIMVDVMTEW